MSLSVQLAVGGIAIQNGRILLIRRATEPEAGRWSLPGGRVEFGETMAEALGREFLEETGLDVVVGERVGIAERIAPNHHFVIIDHMVEVQGRRTAVAGDDASAAQWIPLSELGSCALVSGLLDFLQEHGVVTA